MDDLELLEADDDYYAFLNLPRDVSESVTCNFTNYFVVSQCILKFSISRFTGLV
jgi:hypothetical protein